MRAGFESQAREAAAAAADRQAAAEDRRAAAKDREATVAERAYIEDAWYTLSSADVSEC